MKNSDIKEHILSTTVMLLNEVYELDEITVRKIAEEAHVATGLINYHFKSKVDLLIQTINKIIEDRSRANINRLYDKSISPRKRLRHFLLDITDIVVEYKKYSRLILKHEILSQSFETPRFIEPVLHEIYPHHSINEIKYLAIQVVAPLQLIFLKEDGFYEYMGDGMSYQSAIDSVLLNLGLIKKEEE